MTQIKDNLHFDISTSVIKQLGEQLISDEVTAIMELIKNSYDAEADWVKIDIEVNNTLSDEFHFKGTKGYIILEDNGEGMSKKDIDERWLVISFSAKRVHKEKGEIADGKRIPLGDKGLGRLSTQRIGKQIEIITGVADEEVYYSLAYNWDDFDGKKKLSDVNVIYKTIPKAIGIKGTKIIITSLNNPDIWKGEAFDVFRGELSKMIFPVKEKRPFKVLLTMSGQKVDLDSLNEQLRKQAIGEYKLTFDGKKLKIAIDIKLGKLKGNDASFFEKNILPDSGAEYFNFLTDKNRNKREFLDSKNATYSGTNKELFLKYNLEYDFEDISKYSIIYRDVLVKANPGAFEGEILEYDIRGDFEINEDNEIGTFGSLGEYKRIVKNQAGARIFRDGFGIKPYGLNNNDWLKLSSGQTSGSSFYGIRPGNIIGYFSISNQYNLSLTEKTDREGFIETPYSKNFFLITGKFTDEINTVLERVKRGLNSYKSQLADEQGEFNGSTNKALDGVKNVALEAKNTEQIIDDTLDEIDKSTNEYKLKSENNLFNQDVSSSERDMANSIIDILDVSKKSLTKAKRILDLTANLDTNTDFIAPQIAILKKQLRDFSELAGLGLTAEAWSHEILNILDRISSQTNEIERQLKLSKNVDTSTFIFVEQVKSVIQNLRIQVNHFSPSLKYNREKKREIEVSTFISETKKFFLPKFDKIGCIIEISIIEDFKVKANEGKLTQVFDNILLNSEYWLKQVKQTDVSFTPKVFIEINNPVIRIWDNGNGINDSIAEVIFQPFTTSKPVGEGRGLGLYIVEQIIESMGGAITLSNERNTNNRRYIFQINLESVKS